MAITIFSCYLFSSSSNFLHSKTRRNSLFRDRVKPIYSSSTSVGETQKQDIVIVGAGIAGLATALSLHRLGVKSLVLEQSESLRTGGTSLTLFKNGWRVLDDIGVGTQLREQFLEIQGMVIKSENGRELRSFRFKDEAKDQEVRAVERGILLETLANQLRPNSIRFSSKLANIETAGTSETLLELVDGTQLQAKIVIGCDGIRSPVANWLGFPEPQYVGHCAFRGLGFYPDGQPFEPKVNYVYGRGLRAGYVPVSSTKVYWFVCFNSPSPGPKITDPAVLKNEAQKLVRNWPSELLEIIDRTPDDTIIKTPLVDRWLWPKVSPSVSSGGVVLVGDAWHPMTPNLGQGACCALEDAVVLSGKLATALDAGPVAIDDALKAYEKERWGRIFPLTIRANLVGSLLQWENPIVCAVRNNIVIPKLVKLGPLLAHTNYKCEPLMKTEASQISS
ncbi:hypothetical protein C5167_032342 [Papaver somniferum]|uniref:FAD-binding domain-containing protein n=2 Tax=Papaver somniferum TaxID=3469 RepID=A0A4Y7KB42_PAPSO|nr:monooxygenase 2 isoform X1 [Papaver somniferum]RZC69228.1 hypothetical protein C5167_032342 [Papaver somniferum]